jgi:DNA-binding CsgD family transcriptional regulator
MKLPDDEVRIDPANSAPILTPQGAAVPELVSDEATALAYVAIGFKDQQTAEAMGISLPEARRMIEQATARLGAKNRPNAVMRAVAFGLLDLRPR